MRTLIYDNNDIYNNEETKNISTSMVMKQYIWNINICYLDDNDEAEYENAKISFRLKRKRAEFNILISKSLYDISDTNTIITTRDNSDYIINYTIIYINDRQYFIDIKLLDGIIATLYTSDKLRLNITAPEIISLDQVINTYINEYIDMETQNPSTGIYSLMKISSLNNFIINKFRNNESLCLKFETMVKNIVIDYINNYFNKGKIMYIALNYVVIIDRLSLEDVDDIIYYISVKDDHAEFKVSMLGKTEKLYHYQSYINSLKSNTYTLFILKLRLLSVLLINKNYNYITLSRRINDKKLLSVFNVFYKLLYLFGNDVDYNLMKENIENIVDMIESIRITYGYKVIKFFSDLNNLYIDNEGYESHTNMRIYQKFLYYWKIFIEKNFKKIK